MYFNINDPAQVKTQSQFDAKLSNIYFTGASFVIETITEYLTRVKDRFRFAGTLVTILLPKDGFSAGSFPIKSFSSVIGNFDIKYYAFIDGIGDSNFIEIPIPSNVALSLIGLGTKENPFTLVNDVETPGPNKYYGTSEDGEKGWQPVPNYHDPVTIATGSLAVLQIDNNQVLSITLPTPPEQVNADWNATSGPAEILNKPDLSPIPATTTTLGSVIVGGGLDILPDGTLSVDFTEAPSETDPTVSSYTKGLTSATTLLNEIKTVDGHLSGLDADLLDGYQASDFSLTTHKHYQLYQPDGTNPFVYTNNSDKLFVDGVFQTESAIISSLAGTGLRLATLSAATGAVSALTNGADGTFLAMVSGSPTWTISIPTIKLTSGATDGYYWKCTNSDGSGGWFPIAASQVYKGTINGSTGIPTGETTPLIDGNGSLTGWYYRCVIAGTYDYGDPSGNSITLAVGDDIYYNGSIWQKIPGQGYTLQPATTTVLGGVKIGSGVTVQLDGTISVSTAYRPDTWVPLWSEILNKTTTEVQEGTNLYYTDERAQDAVGTILTDTTSIDFLYDDFLNQIKATVLPAGVDHDLLLNFVGNEHIDHSLVSVTGTGGLGGGGNLTTSRTITHNAKSWIDKTTLTGATVISNLTIDAYGHPTDWTTRTLSAANIGAEPTVTKQNVTAGSNKISLGGAPTSSVFSAFSIDVNEGNLTLNNIGGVLGISKGGTNLSSLGSALQLLRVNSSATALEYWTPNYLTGNQNITWTASGDISGSASGTTSLSPSLTVNAIKNKTVPTLSPGYFYYDGSAWIFKNENYSLDGHTHTQYLTDAPSNGALYGRKDGTWTAVAETLDSVTTRGNTTNNFIGLGITPSAPIHINTSISGWGSIINNTHGSGNGVVIGAALKALEVLNSADFVNPVFQIYGDGTIKWQGAKSEVTTHTLYFNETTKEITYGVSASGADGNNYPVSIGFNTSSGDFTLVRNGLSTLSQNLDGRYSLIHSHPYEPALGNPAADGYVLSSTITGVRSWVPQTDPYTHPTQVSIDTGTLSGATIISKIAVNTLGHTTTVSTRTLTLADLGYFGDTYANYYEHPTGFTNQPSSALTGANVISQVTVNTQGHVTGVTSRILTLANLGYTGETNADYYGSWFWQAQNSSGAQIGVQEISSGFVASIRAGSNVTLSQTGGVITVSSTDTNTTYSPGTGLSLSGTTFNHLSYITAGTISGSSGPVNFGGTINIPSITYNAQGHITGTTTTSITLPTSPAASNYNIEAVTSTSGATIRLLKDSVVTTPTVPINGTGSTTVSWDGTKIVVNSTDTNWYPTAASFSTSTGTLAISGTGMSQVSTSLDGRYSLLGHTHGYDYYGYWYLGANEDYTPIYSGNVANFQGTGATNVYRTGNTIYINSTDTDTNYYPNSLSFNTSNGSLSLSGPGVSLSTSLDGRYLQSYTETDPIYTSSSWYSTTNNSANWNTAYSWGNHAGLYSLLGHTHNYDNYSYWRVTAGLDFADVTSGEALRFKNEDGGLNVYYSNVGGGSSIVIDTKLKTINGNSILGVGNLTISGGTSDHGALTGLGDDDHTQYYNQTRGDARYAWLSGNSNIGFNAERYNIHNTAWTITDYLSQIDFQYNGTGLIQFTTGGVITATNFDLNSDRRLKENIKPINTDPLNIEFVEFNMIGNDSKRYGVIAQQVEEVAPELVKTNEDGIKSVSYIDLLIKKIAELEERIKILEKCQ